MAEVHDFLTTDASNTARWPEGMAPSGVNNAGRADEGLLARWFLDTNYSVACTVSGTVIQMTANRVSITLTATTSNYMADLMMAFTVGSTALVGPHSVNINGIGPIPLRDSAGVSLSATYAHAGTRVLITKDSANNYFRLLSPVVPQGGGTFTPAVAFGGAAVDVAYSIQVGFYTKIGNRVFFQLCINLSSNGSSTGALTITGLPFTANAATNAFSAVTVRADGLTGVTGQVQGYISPSGTSIAMSYLGTGSAADLSDTTVPDTASLIVSGHYFV